MAASNRTATSKHGAEALLDAAERLFLERGYANVSMQQIAEAVGFTKGAAYYHFQSKEDLFLAVSRRIALGLHDQLVSPFDEPGTFEEQLRKSIHMVWESFSGDMHRWWSDAEVVLSDEAKERFIEDTFGVPEPSQVLVPVFRRAAEQGIIRNVSPEVASRIYLGLVSARLNLEKHQWLLKRSDANLRERAVDDIVTVFLYGVQGTKPEGLDGQ